jgi:hypothetical protein
MEALLLQPEKEPIKAKNHLSSLTIVWRGIECNKRKVVKRDQLKVIHIFALFSIICFSFRNEQGRRRGK